MACERIFIKTHSVENRCVIGPENRLFAGASVHLSARRFYRLGQGRGQIVLSVAVFVVNECYFNYMVSYVISTV